MADLIQGLIHVKDPLTLFAFLSLVFLAAFKTKKVPELVLGKLSRERLAQLLHRFMMYGFTAFVLLCAMAVLGQVLDYETRMRPVSVDDLKSELTSSNVSEDQKQAALTSYSQGIDYVQRHEFDQAIDSLKRSIDAVPTLAAQYTLAYLYQKQGDVENAKAAAAAARSAAGLRGDTLAQVQVARLSASVSDQAGNESMIGDKAPLPQGGKSFESAVSLSPGLYLLTKNLDANVFWYFKLRLKAGQTLLVKFRTPETGGYASATIYDADGGSLASNSTYGSNALNSVKWSPAADGYLYVSVGNGIAANSVYRVAVR